MAEPCPTRSLSARGIFGRIPLLLAVGAILLPGLSPNQVKAQATGTVTGIVVNEQSLEPLNGVQMSVPGTGIGLITDEDGRFRLTDVPAGEVRIEARLIGYGTTRKTVSVEPNRTTEVRFELRESALQLEDIVVTGTGSAARRKELGNAVGSIDATELNDLAPAESVAGLLNSESSGLVAMSGTGATGAGARIRIRGAASLSLNDQPLIYVDGVRVNNATGAGPKSQGYGSGVISRLGDFAPSEIDRIEVVKGPAAATLYGTEASNGVIQIFTKKADKNTATEWSLGISQGANWIHDPENTFPGIWGTDPESGEIRSWNMIERETERGTPVFRTGHNQEYSANVQGGASDVSYFLSGSYENLEGVYPTNRVWRLNTRVNVSFLPHEDWTVDASTGYVKADFLLPDDIGSSPIFNAMYTFPFLVDTPTRGFLRAPPEWLYASEQNQQELDRFTGSVQVQHNPADWLRHRLNLGLDATEENNVVHRPFLGPEAEQFFGPAGAKGGRTNFSNAVSFLTADYAATATAALSSDWTTETSAGIQYYARETHETLTEGEEFAAPGLKTVSSTARRFAGETYVRNVTLGTFLQERVSWMDRRFLTAAVRVDNNSAFGQDLEFVTYPKLSGSWVISEEDFWDVGWMSSLRLRAAWGQTGQQPESFSALRFHVPVTTGAGQPGLMPQSPGNSTLAPETGSELETGFEAAFLGERIGVDFTFYQQRVEDVLLQRTLAPSSGFPGAQWVNAGRVDSRGIELDVTASPVTADDVEWDLGVKLSRNWNEVIDVGGAESGTTADGARFIALDTELDTPGIEIRHQEGYAPGSWFGRKVVSAEFAEDGTITGVRCDGGPAVDHQPVACDQAPFVFLGQTQPKVQGAIRSTLRLFDRFTLHGVVDFKFGQKHGNNDSIVQCQLFRVCRENFVPTDYDPVTIAQYQSAGMSNFAIADAGFAKLREVALNYEVPNRWASLVGAGRVRLNLTARNLMTWTDWPGIDPETYFTNPEATNSIFDKATQTFTPHPVRVQAGLNVTF